MTLILNSTLIKRSAFSSAILILGIIFIAANLRAPVTGLAPVLEHISFSFSLTPSQAGMLTTLPLIAFALASPVAANLAKKQGLESSLFIALILIGFGLASRLIDSVTMLYLGTAIIGIGIAIGNVLLPSLIKRDFPHKVAVMTSTYVLAMGIFGGCYSALIIPLAEYKNIGWQIALACYGLLTLISIIIWLPQLKSHTKPTKDLLASVHNNKVWQEALAWQITLLLGLNSFFTYIMIGWLPSILLEAGHSNQYAGALQGSFQIASAIPGIILIPLLAKLNDQRILTSLLASIAATCSLGLLYFPEFAALWTITLGFCSGACFILGLSFISLRTHDTDQATSLSGMAQCLGYLLAAAGPLIAGSLHSYFGNWATTLWLCALASALCAIFGYLGGRNITMKHTLQNP
ncbi:MULTISPECIES: MFS transporter [unclassified Pseudoalteromonas]|uniref:MFS transporter n=1 Tax=unclassified Pseudoalteromonas TaxID=194690 RepID=UPI000C07FA26|nr:MULTISPECIES: MFS transporter [unclassified Pseudoalteromonas]MDP2634369.1 MFS transporter [Pseudoalteromonas sp. 1_MG-2023]PHN89269.1 MFS transporter [Pseudoalteromonas sp. 3D05]